MQLASSASASATTCPSGAPLATDGRNDWKIARRGARTSRLNGEAGAGHEVSGDSQMKKQRVFISGVAGFLGSHLADAFLADGHEVIGVDNMIGGYLDNVPTGVKFYQYDCNDFRQLK